MARDKMPAETIRVGPVDYDVQTLDNLHDDDGFLDGRIRHSDAVIQLSASLAAPARLVTLWHEAVHAISCQGGFNEQPWFAEHAEQLTTVLSYGIVQVLRDNPEMRGASGTDPADGSMPLTEEEWKHVQNSSQLAAQGHLEESLAEYDRLCSYGRRD